MFGALFLKDPLKPCAKKIYANIVSAARNPKLYQRGLTPDTIDGRFEMIIIHAIMHVQATKRYSLKYLTL